jgi:hypothetical protein
MKLHFSSSCLAAAAIFTATLAGQTSAQPAPTGSVPAADALQTAPSAGVADVLKMLDAGVSKDVIKTYIETSSASFAASPSDLIALKNRGVTDDITMAILKHGSSAAPAAAPAPAPAAADNSSAPVRTYIISNRLDPEGYDYFQHYYLTPRTLAYVNQTLGYPSVPYGDGFAPYYPPVYGYGVTLGYGNNLGFGGRRSVPFGRAAAGFSLR